MVLDNFGVANAFKLVSTPLGDQRKILAEPISQAWIEIRNNPELVGPDAMAKDVRAFVSVFDNVDPNRPLFSMDNDLAQSAQCRI